MIYFIQSLPAGTAVQIYMQPPPGAKSWRLLRKGISTFAGVNDPAAVTVLDTQKEKVFTDSVGLVNGQTYYYQPYYWNGSAWSAAAVASAIPAQIYATAGPDPLLFVRQRVDDGVRAMIASGALKHPKNQIQVLAALPQIDTVTLPVITVSMMREAPQERVIGEQPDPNEFDPDAWSWHDAYGWWARSQIRITGWTFNIEERIALRRAIRGIVIANEPVFDAAGLQEIEFAQEDMDDVQSFNAPMFSTVGTFSCLVPAVIEYDEGAIRTVEVQTDPVDVSLIPITARAG